MKSKRFFVIFILILSMFACSTVASFATVGTGMNDDFEIYFTSALNSSLLDSNGNSVSSRLEGSYKIYTISPGVVYSAQYFYSPGSGYYDAVYVNGIQLSMSSSSPTLLDSTFIDSNTIYFQNNNVNYNSTRYYFTFNQNPFYVPPSLDVVYLSFSDGVLTAQSNNTAARTYWLYSETGNAPWRQVNSGIATPTLEVFKNGYYYCIQQKMIDGEYVNSVPSNIVYVNYFLSEGVSGLSLDDNVLSWDSLSDIAYYEVGVSRSSLFVSERSFQVLGNRFEVPSGSLGVKDGYFLAVRAISNEGQVSPWSLPVQFFYNAPEVDPSATLTAPTLSYSNGQLSWNLIQGASGYQIYKDGNLLAVSNSTPFSIYGDGVYQVRAYNQNNEYSVLSNSVTVENFGITVPDSPVRPGSDGSVIDWLTYYAESLEHFFSSIGSAIQKLLISSLQAVQNIAGYIPQFVSAFGGLFDFLPEELRVLFISVISISLLLGVFALVRKR